MAHGLGLLFAVLSFCSCVYDDESATDGGEVQTMQVQFTISMDNLDNVTRAGTWGDSDYDAETATTWENAIQVGKLQVLVFSSADKYIGSVGNVSYGRRSGSENNIYDILGTINIDESLLTDGKLSCKFVVLANYDNAVSGLSAGDDLSEIKDEIFSYNATAIANRTTCIPMWGVQTYTDSNTDTQYKPLTLKKGERTDAGEIFMLRAMAKIRVKLGTSLSGSYKLSNVSISDYATKGYIVPAGYNVSATKSLYYASDATSSDISFNPYADSEADASLNFQAESDGSYIVYVPECNTADIGAHVNLTVTSKTKATDTKSYKMKLSSYDSTGKSTSTGIDLVRNTIYEYTITDLERLSIAYKVMPWTEGGTSNVEYKFSSKLTSERYKQKDISASESAIAVTYAANNAGMSPWLTLEVTTPFSWIIHTDNPYFAFLLEDGSLVSQISRTGEQTVKFKLVPRYAIDFSDANRSYRASVFVSIPNANDGMSGKMPFNSGSNQLPNGDEYEVLFYQVTAAEYATLATGGPKE